MIEWLRRRWAGYALAAASIALAFALRIVLVRYVGAIPTYITFFPVVMIIALLAGLGPGLLATVLTALVAWLWIPATDGQWRIAPLPDSVRMGLFLAMGLFMSLVAESYRRSRQRTAAYEKELAVRRSNVRFRRLFEESSMGMMMIHPQDRRLMQVNSTLCRMLGYNAEELLQRRLDDITHPEDLPATLRIAAYVARGEPSQHTLEKRYLKKDGSVVYAVVQVSILQQEPGQPQFHVALIEDITPRKHAQEEMARRQTLLEAVCNQSDDAIFIKDHQGRLVLANPSFVKQCGIAEERLIGCRAEDFIQDSNALALINASDKRVMESGRPELLDETLPTPHGPRVFRTVKAPWRDQDGVILGVIGIGRDITQRRRDREALEQSEARYAALAAASFEAISISEQGRTIDINEEYTRMLGYSREEVIGREIQSIIASEDRARVMKNILEGKEGSSEHRLLRKDGTVLVVETRARMMTYQNRRVRLAAIRDVTERKKVEDALRESEARFRKVFEEAPVGLSLIHSQQRRVLQVNDALCRILGYTAEELCSRRVEDITHPEDMTASREAIDQLARGDVSSLELVKRYLKKDGSVIHAKVRISALHTEPGQSPLHLGITEDITEHKHTQELLLQNEERLSIAQKAAHFGIFDRNLQARSLVTSPELDHLFGVPTGSFSSRARRWRDFIHPDDLERANALSKQSIEQKTDGEMEYRFFHDDGTLRWIRSIWRTICDDRSEPLRQVGVSMDITERKQAEEALRQSEERFRTLVELLPDAVLVNSGFQVVYANPAAARLFGATGAQDIRGKNILDLAPPDRRASVIADFERFFAGQGVAPPHEGYILRLDGVRLNIYSSAAAIEYNGKPAVLSIFHDITERKKAEEALRQRGAELVAAHAVTRVLIDNARDVMAIVDSAGHILECNQELANRFGCKIEQLGGAILFDYFSPPETPPSRKAWFEKVLATGKPVEFKDSRAGRDYFTSLRPLFNPDGTVRAVALYGTDITEQNKANEAIHQHQVRLRRMASELSLIQARERCDLAVYLHDSIGQDLAAARLQLQMMPQAKLPADLSDAIARTQELIIQSIKRTRAVTFELSPPSLFELGLVSAIERLIEDLQKNHPLKIELRKSKVKPRFLGEGPRVLVYRAVRELLLNVVKHAQARCATVTIEKKSDRFTVTVADDGIGFVPTSTQIRHRFGLFSIHEQIESLGGTFDIQSEPGHGTTARLSLPRDFSIIPPSEDQP